MLTNEELDDLGPRCVWTDAEHEAVIAQAREANALRQRCEDLELMLRSEWRDGWKWFRIMGDGGWTLGHRETGWDTRGQPVCKDDGTGLPLLTEEAREALRGTR